MNKEIDVLALAKQGLLSASHRLDSSDKQLRLLAKEEVDKILETIETHASTMQQVDLTDDELLAILKSVDKQTARLPQGFKLFARAVIAKFKEKNNANNNS